MPDTESTGDVDSDVEIVTSKTTSKPKPSNNKKVKIEDILEELDEEEEELDSKKTKKKQPAKAAKSQPKKKAKRDEDEDDSAISLDEDDEDDEDEKPKKKASKTVTTKKGTKIEYEGEGTVPKTKKEAAAAKKAAAAEQDGITIPGKEPGTVRVVALDDPVVIKYKKMNISQLKDWLRANEQLLSGVKDDLVARCVDGEMNGRLPRCERCQQGKLTFDTTRMVYKCQGYFDTDANMMIRCTFAEPSVTRVVWLDPESAAATSSSAATGDGSSSGQESSSKSSGVSAQVPDSLVDEIASLDPKNAADKLIAFCKETLKLQMPSDDKVARLKIGPLLLTNRDANQKFNVRKVVEEVSKIYPPAADSGAAGGDASASAKKPSGAVSKVPANEPIAALLEELAKYEKLRGGENVQFKVAALKKAAIAVRGLGYEVTDGESLGKPGKNKVEGIGKGTAKQIQEFLETGKKSSPYLEHLKKEVGEA